MKKPQRKLSARHKANKKQRQLQFMTVFINGKQKKIKRPPSIDGVPVDEFIRANADPTWLHQHEAWHILESGPD